MSSPSGAKLGVKFAQNTVDDRCCSGCSIVAGEEVVTRDSFICIGWRMIPYWLNNWEQQWGAECSSMMYELPQFAGGLHNACAGNPARHTPYRQHT